MALELYSKIYEKMTKIRLSDIRYDFETKQNIWFEVWYDNLKTGIQTMFKFQVCISWTDWEITRQRAWRQGRAGSSWISFIWSKRKFFCSMSPIEKNDSFRDTALFESPIWLWKEALDLSSHLVARKNTTGILNTAIKNKV